MKVDLTPNDLDILQHWADESAGEIGFIDDLGTAKEAISLMAKLKLTPHSMDLSRIATAFGMKMLPNPECPCVLCRPGFSTRGVSPGLDWHHVEEGVSFYLGQ